MLPLQQIWNLRHGFSGCFFEATRFSQNMKSKREEKSQTTLVTFATLEHQVIRKTPLNQSESV